MSLLKYSWFFIRAHTFSGNALTIRLEDDGVAVVAVGEKIVLFQGPADGTVGESLYV